MRKTISILLFISLLFFETMAQQDVTTVGIMFKPIIPSNLFRAGDIGVRPERENLTMEMSQKPGYSFGMIIRRGFTENWTVETGLGFVRRNFALTVEDTDSSYRDSIQYGIIGYELPVMALLNIQLDEKVFMNTAFGMTFDMYPSNIAAYGENFNFIALRGSWLQFSLIANIGWEYRTREKGTLYLGGSYHRPFFPMFRTRTEYIGKDYVDYTFANISGNYLTVDLRYFFHEDPEKRKSRKQRKYEKDNPILYRPPSKPSGK